MKILKSILLSIYFLSIGSSQESDTVKVTLEPVIVTAFRVPMKTIYVCRSIDVIDMNAIKVSGALSVEELLQKEANIDVQSRGIFGVQSDVNIRGGLFNQNVVLLNGVRLNDVQTAHHNFDLPISVSQIERIEVIKGASSALYGPDAYGGVINIISRLPNEQDLSIKFSGGEHSLLNTSACYDYSKNNVHSSNVVEYRESDGFRWGTDFKIATFANNTAVDLSNGRAMIFGGYTAKEFGALYFYGKPMDQAPSREWTKTLFLSLSRELSVFNIPMHSKLSYRKHYDKFMFSVLIPDKYVNVHTTHVYSGEVFSSLKLSEYLSFIAGIEGNFDRIVSSNLGNHQRSLVGMSMIIHSVIRNRLILDFGFRQDIHSEYKDQFNPSISIGYLFNKSGKLFFTCGRSFRAPNYTELYYSNPRRIGNPTLQPEIGFSYELGAEYELTTNTRWILSFFQRNQRNIIDYVRFTSIDSVDKATNFAKAVTKGIDFSFRWVSGLGSESKSSRKFEIQRISLSYTYLDSKIDIGNIYSTLYSFRHPKHQTSLGLALDCSYSISFITNAVHKIKLDGKKYMLVDAKLMQSFYRIDIFLQGTNLLNQSYEEVRGVPLPGRWMWAGVDVRIL